MRRSSFIAVCIVVAISTMIGCAKKEEAPLPRSYNAEAPSNKQIDTNNKGKLQRKIVVIRNIHIETSNFITAYSDISKIAEQLGGYNTESSQRQIDDGVNSGKVAMRIPPGGVDSVFALLKKHGTIISENTKGEDITDKYYDIDARLKNAKAAESRLVALLGRNTGKVSDVLEVEKEVTRVRGDIESMEAQKRNMDIETTMVEIIIEISEPHRAFPLARKVWHPIRNAFGEGIEILAYSIRFAVITVLALIPWGIIVWCGIKVRKRYKAKQCVGKDDQDNQAKSEGA